MTSIYLYKRDGGGGRSWRYEISNFERIDIQKNTPVSAMPLPFEDSSENILVKMEGNSEIVQMTWRIPEESVVRVKKKVSNAESPIAINQGLADDDAKWEWSGQSGVYPENDFSKTTIDSVISHDNGWDEPSSGYNPVTTTTGTDTRSGSDTVNHLLSQFEGRDIEDEYFLAIPEMDAREGWLGQLSAQITGDSPVVWTMSATFQTGRVISVYDLDAPSEPRDITLVPSDSNGKTSGEGGYLGSDTRLRLRWVVPIESGGSAIAKYTLYMRTSSSQWMKFS